MDFRDGRYLGTDIEDSTLQTARGYDHNWEVFCNPCATLSDPVSGKNWNLGDSMMITIVRADVNLGKIDFEVAPEAKQ